MVYYIYDLCLQNRSINRPSEVSDLRFEPRPIGSEATIFSHIHTLLVSSGRASGVAVRKMESCGRRHSQAGKPTAVLASL